jgi:segregation and condensation protein B
MHQNRHRQASFALLTGGLFRSPSQTESDMQPTLLRGPQARWQPGRFPRDQALPAIYRLLADSQADGQAEGELVRTTAMSLIEAALVAADEPLPPRKLAQAAGLADAAEARRLVRKLQALYDQDQGAFQVEEIAGGFQLLTRSEFHPWLTRLRRAGNEMRLTAAMRETLAIIAYRQPIMRADIEAIRGVQSGEVLHHLLEKGLIRIAGRHPSLGRPVLYGTTKKFMQVFGLKSLKDLPQVANLQPPPKPAPAQPEPPAPEDGADGASG